MNQHPKKRHVLVIEDNEDVSKVVSLFLMRKGYAVSTAFDGIAGLEKVKAKNKPDLILLDILLPKKDGLDVLREIRKDNQTSAIPVVLMSAVLQTKDIERETKNLQVAHFIQKPFQIRQLLQVVESVLPDGPTELAYVKKSDPGSSAKKYPKKNKPIAIAQTGTFNAIPFPQIIHSIFVHSHTGLLTVSTGGNEKKVYFKNGFPVYAESSIQQETLGFHLMSQNLITPKQHECAMNEMKNQGRYYGEALIRLRFIAPNDLFNAMQAHLIHKITSLFEWPDGQFSFDHGDLWKDDIIILKMPPGRIITSGICKYWPPNHPIANDIVHPNEMPFLTDTCPYSIDELNLSTREARLISLIKHKHTNAQLIDLTHKDIPTIPMLLSLYLCEKIGFLKEHKQSHFLPENEPHKISEKKSRPTKSKKEDQARIILTEYLKYRNADYFTFLGISRDATQTQIETSYLERQQRYHPDTMVGIDTGVVHEKAEELYLRTHMAYRTLIDPILKNQYLEKLKKQQNTLLLKGSEKNCQYKRDESTQLPQRLFERGFSSLKNGDFTKAKTYFENALERETNTKYTAYVKWAAYLADPAGEKSATEQQLTQLLNKNQDNPLLSYLLGCFYLRESTHQKALRFFQITLKKDPQHIDAARQIRILKLRAKKETSGLFDLFKKKPK